MLRFYNKDGNGSQVTCQVTIKDEEGYDTIAQSQDTWETAIKTEQETLLNTKLQITDLPGDWGHRGKWIQYFNKIDSVIYTVDSSAYDIESESGIVENALRNSLEIFKRLWHNRWLKNVSYIVVLNKIDLLAEKLRVDDSFAIEFPESIDHYYSSVAEPELAERFHDPELARIISFIRKMFTDVALHDYAEFDRLECHLVVSFLSFQNKE